MTQLETMLAELKQIQTERDWEQFHSPRDVAEALIIESAELLEHYRWGNEPTDLVALELEAGDVFYNFLLFCQVAKIDPSRALAATIAKVHVKYPVAGFKGSSRKYNQPKEQ